MNNYIIKNETMIIYGTVYNNCTLNYNNESEYTMIILINDCNNKHIRSMVLPTTDNPFLTNEKFDIKDISKKWMKLSELVKFMNRNTINQPKKTETKCVTNCNKCNNNDIKIKKYSGNLKDLINECNNTNNKIKTNYSEYMKQNGYFNKKKEEDKINKNNTETNNKKETSNDINLDKLFIDFIKTLDQIETEQKKNDTNKSNIDSEIESLFNPITFWSEWM